METNKMSNSVFELMRVSSEVLYSLRLTPKPFLSNFSYANSWCTHVLQVYIFLFDMQITLLFPLGTLSWNSNDMFI